MARLDMGEFEVAPFAGIAPAAEQYFELGIHYATDGDGEADLIAAHKWFNLAAINGNAEAAEHRQQIAREMTAAAIAAAQRAAREWLRTH